ncbi:hypothetical protein PAXRUDRAFT_17628 [Paxillus rubicundulus Ve08.2h10]|uniref:Uncharacterized protein n=1 Tax=Paxillus rubicundulus Ve08.2h10 TaxID=930991 RepID=A0A0D0D136_9AGAM|nr:hypothetical protein PAXRUDRAFT_17628 [Paxillus rubicundulus Ve08.2h10]
MLDLLVELLLEELAAESHLWSEQELLAAYDAILSGEDCDNICAFNLIMMSGIS